MRWGHLHVLVPSLRVGVDTEWRMGANSMRDGMFGGYLLRGYRNVAPVV